MTRLRVLCCRLFSLLRGGDWERSLDEELNFHLQMEIASNVRLGMNPQDSRSAALMRFGGVAQIKEIYRETRGLPIMEILWQDLRFGFRTLRRNPAFSIVAIGCLTLGIGANAAVFSWMEGILLRPFPLVTHQERLMAVAGTDRGAPGHTDVSWPDFQDFQRNCTLCDAFIVDRITGTTLSIGERAERSPASVVSANYFDALGVHPILGRGFEPAEDFGRNAHPVTVISYQMWQERFHGDPAIIGKTQMLNGMPHTIVGVAPAGFHGTFVGWAMQFWVPVSMQEMFDPADTNWRTAARFGSKVSCGSNRVWGRNRRRRRFQQWRNGWKPPIPRPTAAAASSCTRYGKPLLITRALSCQRSGSCSLWRFSCSSSPVRTSAICCW